MRAREVALAATEKTGQALDPEVEKAMDELWSPASPITVVELFPKIAIQARKLVRDGMVTNRRIKPFDAIHLATAVHLKADALITYNLADFDRWGEDLAIRVEHPSVQQPPLQAEGLAGL